MQLKMGAVVPNFSTAVDRAAGHCTVRGVVRLVLDSVPGLAFKGLAYKSLRVA